MEKIKFEDEDVDKNISNAEVYDNMGTLYEEMSELVLAANVFNKALAIVEKVPREYLLHNRWMVVLSTSIGQLLLKLEGNEPLAISYLKRGAKMLKWAIDSGATYLEIDLGFTYNVLGTAYIKAGRMETAVEVLLKAKDIAFASQGPENRVSIWICWNLVEAYSKMERISLAIDLMREVVEALESHRPSEEEQFKNARNYLQMLEDMDQS